MKADLQTREICTFNTKTKLQRNIKIECNEQCMFMQSKYLFVKPVLSYGAFMCGWEAVKYRVCWRDSLSMTWWAPFWGLVWLVTFFSNRVNKHASLMTHNNFTTFKWVTIYLSTLVENRVFVFLLQALVLLSFSLEGLWQIYSFMCFY